MVKILASGEIVADDDPRAGGGDNRASGQSGYNAPRQRQGGIHQGGEQEPVAHMPEGSMFEALNQKLVDMGLPRWNIGSYVVEPLVSVGFILAFLLMGVRGLVFAGLLFFVSKYSMGGGGPGQGFSGWRGRGLGQGDGGQGGDHRPRPQGGGGGGGYTLGRS